MRRRRLALATALAVLAATSCAGDDGDRSTPTETSGTPGTTTVASGAATLPAGADPSVAHLAPTPLTLPDGSVVRAPSSGSTSDSSPSTTSPPTTATGSTTTAPPPPVDLQDVIDAYREREGISAIAVAVVRPGADDSMEVTTYLSGTTSEGGSPLAATDRFEIGSETKTFTAGLLAQAVADGRIALDDPVQDHLPDGVTVPTWPGGAPMTIADLATHQAGLPDEPPNLDDRDPAAKSQYTREMLWAALPETDLLWEPGTRWLYSNYGFGLLGTILADLDQPGQAEPPFGPVVADVLTDPLGLTATGLEDCEVWTCPAMPDLVVPYGADGSPAPYWNNVQALAGGGGLVSDIGDMATWITAALGEPGAISSFATVPLQPVSTIETVCLAPDRCSPPAMDFRMGLAWQLFDGADWIADAYAFKDGGTGGMHSSTFLVPGRRLGVTVLSDSPSRIDDLGQLLLLAIDGHVDR